MNRNNSIRNDRSVGRFWLLGFGGAFDPLPRLDESLLYCAVSKHLGHFPEGLIEFHILIDALDCPALGHPATVRAAAGTGRADHRE